MRIRIDDITKGTFSLPTPIGTRDKHLKIGVKNTGCWVGFYNIREEQICQWRRDGRKITKFKIDPGFYSFKDLLKILKGEVLRLNVLLNKNTGLIDLTHPERVDLWLTDAMIYMIGLDDDNEWLDSAHDEINL